MVMGMEGGKRGRSDAGEGRNDETIEMRASVWALGLSTPLV